MSELAEIRESHQELRDIALTTSADVSWIKDAMKDSTRRLEAHMGDDEKRISKLERRQSWTSGAAAVLGILFGSAAEHFFNK